MKPTVRRHVRAAARFEALEERTLLTFTIGSLSDSPDPVYNGQGVTLTANNVVYTNGRPFAIEFYLESNGISGLQRLTDTYLDSDGNGAGGFSVTVSTAGLANTTYTYYAQGVEA